MSTYTVQGGDSLSAIARKLGLSSWQELYNANREIIGSNANYIRPGQTLTIPGTQTNYSVTNNDPAQQIASGITANIKTPEKNFSELYPSSSLFPVQSMQQFAESQVNPEYLREAQAKTSAYDTGANISGAYRTGESALQRQSLLDSIERARKAEATGYVTTQSDLFNDWYNREMLSYSTDPSKYVMTGYENQPWYTDVKAATSTPANYTYTPLDISKMFGYGIYDTGQMNNPYSAITKI